MEQASPTQRNLLPTPVPLLALHLFIHFSWSSPCRHLSSRSCIGQVMVLGKAQQLSGLIHQKIHFLFTQNPGGVGWSFQASALCEMTPGSRLFPSCGSAFSILETSSALTFIADATNEPVEEKGEREEEHGVTETMVSFWRKREQPSYLSLLDIVMHLE